MPSDAVSQTTSTVDQRWADRLQQAHRGGHRPVLIVVTLAVVAFLAWSAVFSIDEVARAAGEVITSNRVQVIQSVDGGVLDELLVREGDQVQPGQVLARLKQTRFASSVDEIQIHLYALEAKIARLRAEVVGDETLKFADELVRRAPATTRVEQALFVQRRTGLNEELRTLQVAEDLARRELALVQALVKEGNRFLEDARLELTKAENEIAQNEQLLIRRMEEQADSVFTALVPGIVKNIRITTVGGVLARGEELMQIVPIEDELLIEARVRPSDIAQVQSGLTANLRFDPFDYTIYGAAPAKVTYVSADTLKEQSEQGTSVYYRAHLKPVGFPVRTTTGQVLKLVPGMTVQVDIRTGQRSLMDVLLKPLRKTLDQSFGER